MSYFFLAQIQQSVDHERPDRPMLQSQVNSLYLQLDHSWRYFALDNSAVFGGAHHIDDCWFIAEEEDKEGEISVGG